MTHRDLSLKLAGFVSQIDDLRSLAVELQMLPPAAAPSLNRSVLIEIAREEFESRLVRPRFFGSEFPFGEPGWDMLLDLYVAEAGGKKLTITSVGALARISAGTSYRWIEILEDQGLVERQKDPSDRRRQWVVLTTHGRQSLEDYLGARAKRREKVSGW